MKNHSKILMIGLPIITVLVTTLWAGQLPDGSPFTVNGSIEIISAPDQAMVHIDGKKKGLTPFKTELAVGQHTLKIHKQGYEDYTQAFEVVPGENKSIGVALVKLTDVSITSKPKGAAIYMDGSLIGTTPLKMKLPTGKHQLQLELLGYGEWAEEIIIVEDYSNKITLQKLYEINFSSEPIAAEVFMDNTYLGDTPFRGDYPAGEHLIKIQLEGYHPFEKEIKLKKNMEIDPELKSLKSGGGFFKKTLFLAAIAGGGYYYYITYVDTPEDAGFPTPPSRP